MARTRSTATAAQEQRIVDALRSGPKTTDELRQLGCYQSSARIWGLRARGYEIETDLFSGYAADGYSHVRMARYTLKSEPLPLDVTTQPESQCGALEASA
jgi:isopenicillin N synthase-like dioxygenase